MKGKLSLLLLAGALLVSCGNSKVVIDPDTPENEARAVNYVADHLSRGQEIIDYKVVIGDFPLALEDGRMKGLRDDVNKALLDYRACVTRNLTEAATQNLAKVDAISQQLRDIIAKDNSKDRYLIVLARIKEKRLAHGAVTGIVAVFDTSGNKLVEYREVTAPVANNALMLELASRNDLGSIIFNDTQLMRQVAMTSTDQVNSFILSVDAK